MFGIGAVAMADMVIRYPFVLDIDEIEPPLCRVDAEIGNSDDIALPDSATDPSQLLARDVEQRAIARGVGIGLREGARRKGCDCTCCQRPFQKIAPFHASITITRPIAG